MEFVKKKLRDLNDEFLHRLLVDIHRQCNSHVGMKTAGIAVQTMYVMQVQFIAKMRAQKMPIVNIPSRYFSSAFLWSKYK